MHRFFVVGISDAIKMSLVCSPLKLINYTIFQDPQTCQNATLTTTQLTQQVLDAVGRLLKVNLSELQSTATTEVVHKLVMDLVQHGPPAVSLSALPLYITLLYSVPRYRTRN